MAISSFAASAAVYACGVAAILALVVSLAATREQRLLPADQRTSSSLSPDPTAGDNGIVVTDTALPPPRPPPLPPPSPPPANAPATGDQRPGPPTDPDPGPSPTSPTTPTPAPTPPTPTREPPPEPAPAQDHMQHRTQYDLNLNAMDYRYDQVLGDTFLFYEAQRSGALSAAPGGNRISWRGDQLLQDGQDIGEDLVGGHYEAGNRLKVTLAEGFFASRMALSCFYFRDTWGRLAYDGRTMMHWCKREVKYAAEFLLKTILPQRQEPQSTWPSDGRLVVMVGHVPDDFACFRRASNIPNTPSAGATDRECPPSARATLVADANSPASDSAGQAAAALAAAAFLLYDDDPTWAQKAIKAAHGLHDFAVRNAGVAGSWSDQVRQTYNSHNPEQHQLWSAAMLAYVHSCSPTLYPGNTLCDAALADSFYGQADLLFMSNSERLEYLVSNWDNPTFDAALLLARTALARGDVQQVAKYRQPLESFIREYVRAEGPYVTASPKGLRRYDTETWATLRLGSFSSAIALMYATLPGTPEEFVRTGRCLGRSQLNYILGYTTGMSYVIGFGANYPTKVHHRDSSCTLPEDTGDGVCARLFFSDRPNPIILQGGLVGGPSRTDDTFLDDRGEVHYTETALDYSVGLVGALAAMMSVEPAFWVPPAESCASLIPNYPWKTE